MSSLNLVGGERLTAEQAELVKADEDTHVVVLAGPHHCGKTTLVSSIYSQLHYGPVASLSFAGSRTLIGFDHRAHLARTASDSPAPGAERTFPSESNSYLHLQVADETGLDRTLLIADWWGEEYERVVNSLDYARTMDSLKACDHLVVLLDGERINDSADRHEVLGESIMLLRSCLDTGTMKAGVSGSIVFSKWDLVHGKRGTTKAAKWVDSAKERLESLFSERFTTLRFFRTSSLDPMIGRNVSWPNIDDLFRFWVERAPEIRAIGDLE